MATIYRPNKDPEPWTGSTTDFRAFQKEVGGIVSEVFLPDGRVIILNDDGKLLGLPFNEQATVMFRRAFDFPVADFLVGNVLLFTAEEVAAWDE